MDIIQVIHIPIIALINLGIIYLWNLKVRNRAMRSQAFGPFVFGSLFNVWGLDVIQRDFVVESLYSMVIVSAGCWLVFVLATNAKYLAIYGWSKRDFWLDYAGDLVSFIISGILVYLVT